MLTGRLSVPVLAIWMGSPPPLYQWVSVVSGLGFRLPRHGEEWCFGTNNCVELRFVISGGQDKFRDTIIRCPNSAQRDWYKINIDVWRVQAGTPKREMPMLRCWTDSLSTFSHSLLSPHVFTTLVASPWQEHAQPLSNTVFSTRSRPRDGHN
jgi:hypothetical protein